jgi:hypothetical protein
LSCVAGGDEGVDVGVGEAGGAAEVGEGGAEAQPQLGRAASSRMARISASVLRLWRAARARRARWVSSERLRMVTAGIRLTTDKTRRLQSRANFDIKSFLGT